MNAGAEVNPRRICAWQTSNSAAHGGSSAGCGKGAIQLIMLRLKLPPKLSGVGSKAKGSITSQHEQDYISLWDPIEIAQPCRAVRTHPGGTCPHAAITRQMKGLHIPDSCGGHMKAQKLAQLSCIAGWH